MRLLDSRGADEVRCHAAGALAALAWGSPDAQAAALRAGVVVPLVRLLQQGQARPLDGRPSLDTPPPSDSCKEQAAGAIAALAWGNVGMQEQFGASGAVAALVETLQMAAAKASVTARGGVGEDRSAAVLEQASAALWALLVNGNAANARRAQAAQALPVLTWLAAYGEGATKRNSEGCLRFLQ